MAIPTSIRAPVISPLLLFVLVAVWVTWPVAPHLTTAIPIGCEPASTVPLFNLWTMWWNVDRIDHAYAVTSYAVQGATFAASTSRIDERSSRSETYVDLTRGRRENHLFATRASDPLDGERLPRAPDPPLDVSLTIRLRASGAELTAWELDPRALDRVARAAVAPSIT